MSRAPLAAIAALIWLAACGPVTYVGQVTRTAASEVEAARAAQADKYAPYWFTLAVEYLEKAREEAAEADFQAANRFGRRAAEAAEKAVAEALAASRRAAEPAGEDAAPRGARE
jgi:hypothetical protein